MARHKVFLGLPSGGNLHPSCAKAVFRPPEAHEVTVYESHSTAGNFNRLLAHALNLSEQGKHTHFAMIHSDIGPEEPPAAHWLDTLLAEMDRLNADLMSVAVPIKDARGVLSCGVGDPREPWRPLRRLTLRDLEELPATFGVAEALMLFHAQAQRRLAEAEEALRSANAFESRRLAREIAGLKAEVRLAEGRNPEDYPLLHNNGLWVADLRKPLWHQPTAHKEAPVFFRYIETITRAGGQWVHAQESEDWYFSRKLHELKARTFVTQSVRLLHFGSFAWPNTGGWGAYKEGDRDLESKWKTPAAAEPAGVNRG